MKKTIIITILVLLTINIVSAYTNSTGLLFELRYEGNFTDTYNYTTAQNTSGIRINNTNCIVGSCAHVDGYGEQLILTNQTFWRNQQSLTNFTINFWVKENDNTANRYDRFIYVNSTIDNGVLINWYSGSSSSYEVVQIRPSLTTYSLRPTTTI